MKIKKTFLLSLSLVALGAYAQEADKTTTSTFPAPTAVTETSEYKVHMGANVGFNTPEGSNGTTANVGVEVGYQPYIPYGVGAELFTTHIDSDNNQDEQRTALLAKGSYNFGGEAPVIRHSWIGLGAGPVYSGDTWEVGLAPQLGFDLPFDSVEFPGISMGGNAKYLVTSTDTPDAFMLNLALKYWF